MNSLVVVNEKFPVSRETVLAILVMDRSGSMADYGKTPVSCVNEYLDSLRLAKDGKQYICGMVSFASQSRVEFPPTPVEKLDKYTDYAPADMTLLWQTVDEVLQDTLRYHRELSAEERSRLRVVVGVFSDGEDNRSSQPQYPSRLQQTSAEAIDAGFELLVFGIGINSNQLAANMGFPHDKAQTYEASDAGLHDSVISMTQTTMGGFRPKD